ncbi:MAG: glycosyltransferase family 2 protein [Kiritimatiellae bacterium]|nr:glycosyltransferase family 2 protein [Kiritimatiellia bacterium]
MISIVVPVFNSEACLDELVRRLEPVLGRRPAGGEIILVNDGSHDRSWAAIARLAAEHPVVRGLNLRRNFGQDNAIMAGLREARGSVAVIMDDDLQHDPDDVARLVEQIEDGYDVCFADFEKKYQAWWKNWGSRFNNFVATIVLKKPRHVYLSPFKALSKDIVREVVKYDGPYPYIDGLILRVTRSVARIDAEHHHRFAGKSNYSVLKSIGVWLRVLTSFSLAPLRLATYMGFVFSGIGLAVALVFLVRKLLGVEVPMGWASLIVAVLVLGGVQLAGIGMLGEYLGRVFLHLNRQPQYVVKEYAGDRGAGQQTRGETS